MKNILFFLMLFFFCVLIAGCEEKPPVLQSFQTINNQVTTKSSGDNSVTDKIVGSVWPFIGADSTNETFSDNLVASNIVLVYDGSGSMSGEGCSGNLKKYEAARDATLSWASLVPSETYLGIVAFSDNGWSQASLENGNRQEFSDIVKSIYPGGDTPLATAFKYAYEMLTVQAKKQLGYGEYTVVAVTDGAARDINALEQWVNYIVDNTPIQIKTIGFCIDSDHTLNQQGRTTYQTADNPEALERGLKSVLAEAESFDVVEFK